MHAVKISWVGQTFALAKCSDSGGKRSRIRRTKEERKKMVESFIKKYQNSNNGNFPSLNLTHKEVGGSFYTVREIVREIIQENRVLGPAKLTSEEQNSDQFSEQYPLGTISKEPQIHLSLSSNATHFVPDDHQITSEKQVSTSSGQFTGQQQQRFDTGRYINGILVDEEYKEADASKSSEQGRVGEQLNDETLYSDVQVSQELEEKLEGVENMVQASTSRVTPIATDVVVETFPLKSAAKLTQDTDERSEEASDLTGTLEELEINKVEVASELGNTGSVLDRLDSLEKHSSGSMDEKAVANLADPLFESLSVSTSGKNIAGSVMESSDLQVDASCNDVLAMQASDENQVVAGIEPKIAPNDVRTENVNANNSMFGESLSQEAVVIETKADIQNTCSTKEERNSTLNRINLESWEGPSKKPAEAETNPVWVVFRAFITAFVKFWTE